jgi:hypothetical protein
VLVYAPYRTADKFHLRLFRTTDHFLIGWCTSRQLLVSMFVEILLCLGKFVIGVIVTYGFLSLLFVHLSEIAFKALSGNFVKA